MSINKLDVISTGDRRTNEQALNVDENNRGVCITKIYTKIAVIVAQSLLANIVTNIILNLIAHKLKEMGYKEN